MTTPPKTTPLRKAIEALEAGHHIAQTHSLWLEQQQGDHQCYLGADGCDDICVQRSYFYQDYELIKQALKDLKAFAPVLADMERLAEYHLGKNPEETLCYEANKYFYPALTAWCKERGKENV